MQGKVCSVCVPQWRTCFRAFGLLLGSGLATLGSAGEPPVSLDDFLQLEEGKASDEKPGESKDTGWNPKFSGFTGFFENKTAYTYASPGHWSLSRNLLQLGAKGALSSSTKWLISGWAGYDPVYATTDFYPPAVRNNQTFEIMFRETYLDTSLADWDFRIGRQHIIWGEMVGLFFADVVTAKDFRQFVVQNLDTLRIPQWAIRTEYFKNDFHAEAIWIPVVTYDNIGKVGAEFFPFNPPPVPGFETRILNDHHPTKSMDNTAYGLRLSYLWSGIDASIFYYSTPDSSPAYAQTIDSGAVPSIIYTPVHKRVQKWGATFSKDITDNLLLRGESVYTLDRPFNLGAEGGADGLANQDILDYVLGLNFNFADDTRLNLQFFQSIFTRYTSGNPLPQVATGYSILLSTRAFHPKVEPQITYIQFINNTNWMLQARTTWEFATNWRVAAGVDVFNGPPNSLFGQFDYRDRVYTELRYSF